MNYMGDALPINRKYVYVLYSSLSSIYNKKIIQICFNYQRNSYTNANTVGIHSHLDDIYLQFKVYVIQIYIINWIGYI